MDGPRFDSLAGSFAAALTRRAFGAGLAAAVAAHVATPETDAAGGRKKARCKGKKTACGRKCVNTRKDRKNCGTCGNRCPAGTACTGGKCRCPEAGREVCGKRCVDTQTDRKHCGACGNACTGDLACSGGRCRCTKAACLVEEWDNEDGPAGEYSPAGIAVDGQFLYAADANNNRVLKFRLSGEFVAAWGRFGVDDGEFQEPQGIAVDRDGNVYVADNENDRIQKFAPDGTFLAKWSPSQLSYPTGIAVGSNGDVVVADYGVTVLNPDGSFVRDWEEAGPDGPYFWPDTQIALDRDDRVYVPDADSNTVNKFTLDGELLWRVGETGDEPGEFYSPEGVAFDAQGRVFVADVNNERVQVLDPDDGAFLFEWPAEGSWLAIDGDGFVYTSGWGNTAGYAIRKYILGSDPADNRNSDTTRRTDGGNR